MYEVNAYVDLRMQCCYVFATCAATMAVIMQPPFKPASFVAMKHAHYSK